MPLKTKKMRPKAVGQLRRAQILTTYGPGALADLADYSVIMASTDYWNENDEMIHERNLERLLNVKGFRQPYSRTEGISDAPNPDIPAFRFPTMYYCPECHRLKPFYSFGKDNVRKCPECNKLLVPSRFLIGCINGHLEDFPYNWWVHRGDFSSCDAKEAAKNLKIYFSNESSGLESITIECTLCHARRTMQGCMSLDAMAGYHCRGRRPWYSTFDEKVKDSEPCNAKIHTLMRGSSNIYFSVTQSALTIPPWSGKINAELARKRTEIDAMLAMLKNFDVNVKKQMLANWCKTEFADTLLNRKVCDVQEIVKRILEDEKADAEEYTRKDLLEDEYRVFQIGDYAEPTDQDFQIERTEIADDLKEYLSSVVLVKRLREVMALQGFRRITPEEGNPDLENKMFYGYNQSKGYTPLSDPEKDWLPAIQMYGEGIFLCLQEEKVQEWEKQNAGVYSQMAERLAESQMRCDNFSPRYVLLHTLAHLLIRQLSLDCGYSAASLKERIYSTFPGSDTKMCGILIYTATSDADGSLGGLVRMGQKKQLENVFLNMLQEASWCSSDPICIKSKAQGYNSLNYAACHACTLLPETSCEMRNCLLDRASVVGDIDVRGRGFFEKLIR